MLVFPPDHHGVVVTFSARVFIGPLIFCAEKFCYRNATLRLKCVFILEIAQPQSWIVETSFLNYYEHSGLVESLDLHLGDIFIYELEVDRSDRFGFQIVDVNFALRDVKNDDLLFVELAEEVYDVFISVLI